MIRVKVLNIDGGAEAEAGALCKRGNRAVGGNFDDTTVGRAQMQSGTRRAAEESRFMGINMSRILK